MSLIVKKMEEDLKAAMIARDAVRTSTLRSLKSALKYAAIEKKKDVLSESEAFAVVQKMLRQHQESIAQFSQAGRSDLVEKESAEARLLEAYLPPALSEEELNAEVRRAVADCGASSKKDFGRVMKHLTQKLAGRADSKKISEKLGALLP